MYSARQPASFERDMSASSIPAIFSDPDVGRSMPAIRLSSVVLPLPLGPIRARKVPFSTSRSSRSSGLMTLSPRRYSRVSCRHSMSAMTAAPFVFLACREVRLAGDADALPVAQPLKVGDELIARGEAGSDRHPAVNLRLAELDRAVRRGAAAAIDHPRHRVIAHAVHKAQRREDHLPPGRARAPRGPRAA